MSSKETDWKATLNFINPSDKNYVERLFIVIMCMYRKKESSPTDNKGKFLKRKEPVEEDITDYTEDLKDSLYQA